MKTVANSGAATTGAYLEFRGRTATGSANGSANRGGSIVTTTGWTQYIVNFTTSSSTRFICPQPSINGSDGAGTLIMDAWFDDITLVPTVNTTRGNIVG